jgi:hypothetical protein
MSYELPPLPEALPEIYFQFDQEGAPLATMEFRDLDMLAALLTKLSPDPFGRPTLRRDLTNYLNGTTETPRPLSEPQPMGREGEFNGRVIRARHRMRICYKLIVAPSVTANLDDTAFDSHLRSQLELAKEAA